jgi:hypothetical protein
MSETPETPEQKEAWKKLDAIVDEVEEEELDTVELGRFGGRARGLGFWAPRFNLPFFARRRPVSPPPAKDDEK